MRDVRIIIAAERRNIKQGNCWAPRVEISIQRGCEPLLTPYTSGVIGGSIGSPGHIVNNPSVTMVVIEAHGVGGVGQT